MAFQFIDQPPWQMAYSPAAGLGVLLRKEDPRAMEIGVMQLNPHKFTYSAAQLIDRTHHELVPVIVYGIEELLPFFPGHIPYSLAKSVVFR